MNFFTVLKEKPWQTNSHYQQEFADKTELFPQKTALRFFIGMVGIIFFLFTITFLGRTQYPDFQALAGEPWLPFTNSFQLWFNTGILLLASAALFSTGKAAEAQRINLVIAGLFFTFLLSFLFLLGQLSVWKHLNSLGYFINSNPANSYYYLFTCVHGLHLVGGLLVLIKMTYKFLSKGSLDLLSKGLILCKTYWNFLLIVWLFLFALLTSSSETYQTIAILCGF